MAIDDTTTYGLTGAQIKDLADKINSGTIKNITSSSFYIADNADGVYVVGDGSALDSCSVKGNSSSDSNNTYVMRAGSGISIKTVGSGTNAYRRIVMFGLVGNNTNTQVYGLVCAYVLNSTPSAITVNYKYSPPVDALNSQDATTPLSANQGRVLKGLIDSLTPAIETYTIADTAWTALASSSPYTYSADVTATHTIGNDTVIEMLNDQPVLFAEYGFAVGATSGQTVTIYSIGAPSASTTLKIRYTG